MGQFTIKISHGREKAFLNSSLSYYLFIFWYKIYISMKIKKDILNLSKCHKLIIGRL